MRTKQILWRTYFFIVVSSLIATLAMMYVEWLDVESKAKTDLRYANNLVTRSMQQVLNKDEVLLDIVGKRLVEYLSAQQVLKAQTLINFLLKKNPDLAGLGLANINGQLILTSGNIDRTKLPNLLTTEETRESFNEALSSNSMVVGRTYYMKALKDWVIPLRYRIVDSKNAVVAVMTTGLKLESTYSLWSEYNLPDKVQLAVIRSDYYRQYGRYDNDVDRSSLYSKPEYWLQGVIEKNIGGNVSAAKNEPISFYMQNKSGVNCLAQVSFDAVYRHYTITSIELSVLHSRVLVPFLWLITLFILFNVALFLIFKRNDRLQEQSKNKLRFQAKHDDLTHMPNRRYLMEEFDCWEKAQKGKFSVLFIDLDDFKVSNDIYGHSTGDKILQAVAKRINTFFSDCMAIRHGGDEFIILSSETDEKILMDVCNLFNAKLQEPIVINEHIFYNHASIGIVSAPIDGKSIDELLRKADMAMYRAKKMKNSVCVYSSELEEFAERRANIENELVLALEHKEFYMKYQPQVNAETNEVIGVEALLRWQNKKLGLVPPDEFIPIAEAIGLMPELGKYVYSTAVEDMVGICEKLNQKSNSISLNKLRLSINVSVKQLENHEFVEHVEMVMSQFSNTDFNVMIEVTESVFINDFDKIKLLLEELTALGIGISLDDFGTGYSSLSVINELPICELKIDKAFLYNILSNNQAWLLIKSIISLSGNMGIPIVAEGVENDAQRELLARNGCDFLQGYYFSKPLNKIEIINYVKDRNKITS